MRKKNPILFYSLLISISLYIGGLLIGVLLSRAINPDLGAFNGSTGKDWFDYFGHNFSIQLLLSVGFITFCIINVSLLLINGFLYGHLLGYSVVNNMLYDFLALTIPHGIFEIPATILASTLGFYILITICRCIYKKEIRAIFTKSKGLFYLKFLSVIFLFQLIASFIEAYFHLI